jgi:hypothetical protein
MALNKKNVVKSPSLNIYYPNQKLRDANSIMNLKHKVPIEK